MKVIFDVIIFSGGFEVFICYKDNKEYFYILFSCLLIFMDNNYIVISLFNISDYNDKPDIKIYSLTKDK